MQWGGATRVSVRASGTRRRSARDAPREVCELALAHVNTNAIEAAYRRTELFRAAEAHGAVGHVPGRGRSRVTTAAPPWALVDGGPPRPLRPVSQHIQCAHIGTGEGKLRPPSNPRPLAPLPEQGAGGSGTGSNRNRTHNDPGCAERGAGYRAGGLCDLAAWTATDGRGSRWCAAMHDETERERDAGDVRGGCRSRGSEPWRSRGSCQRSGDAGRDFRGPSRHSTG